MKKLDQVDLTGRQFPFPRQAVEALRAALEKDGHTVLSIWPVERTPGAICPWGATAVIDKKK